jgi:hypothetical protein
VASNCSFGRFHDDDTYWHLPKTDKENSCHLITQTFIYMFNLGKPAFKYYYYNRDKILLKNMLCALMFSIPNLRLTFLKRMFLFRAVLTHSLAWQ